MMTNRINSERLRGALVIKDRQLLFYSCFWDWEYMVSQSNKVERVWHLWNWTNN